MLVFLKARSLRSLTCVQKHLDHELPIVHLCQTRHVLRRALIPDYILLQVLPVHFDKHLQLAYCREMVNHVRSQDCSNYNFPHGSPLGVVQTLEYVQLGLPNNVVQCRAVHVFQWALIVVQERNFVFRFDQELVAQPWVANIVGETALIIGG